MQRKLFYISIFLLIIVGVIYLLTKNRNMFHASQNKSIMLTKEQKDTLKIDFIKVWKSKRTMEIYSNNNLIKEYKIALGANPIGDKEFEGDKKTPEGIYVIDSKNPNSQYHKNLGISYPNEEDRKHAEQLGKSPGGDIKIHGFSPTFKGDQNLFKNVDWTIGCIAVTDAEIDELYEIIEIGTKIEIVP